MVSIGHTTLYILLIHLAKTTTSISPYGRVCLRAARSLGGVQLPRLDAYIRRADRRGGRRRTNMEKSPPRSTASTPSAAAAHRPSRQGNHRQPAAVGADGAGIPAAEQVGELALVMSDEGAQRDLPDDGSSIVCNRSSLASLACRMDSTGEGVQARNGFVSPANLPSFSYVAPSG